MIKLHICEDFKTKRLRTYPEQWLSTEYQDHRCNVDENYNKIYSQSLIVLIQEHPIHTHINFLG